MGILGGNPKNEPLNYGEVSSLWSMSMMAKGLFSCYQAWSYHAGDKDVKAMLKDLMEQSKLESKECDELLLDNGITPAPALPERPEAKWEDIPVGARFMDPEIAMFLAHDTAVGLTACSQAIAMSTREDVGALFAKYHATKAVFAARILRLNKEKGWLVPPPLQIERPEPVGV
ncbi:DUF3231 family protein [Paenibacillus turpanensis]|uniref:DUF3231 family protein n=1 Tax=Paenibacillus turpanensis TaxID=2689078 RepID=UPI00140D15B1|nr:DUF3231 family protein [Paenibacillus turpanensis]